MRLAAGLLGLLIAAGVLVAADPPGAVTVKPGAVGAVKLGQTVYLSYPYRKDHTARLKRLIIDGKNVVGLKEFYTGPRDTGDSNVVYRPTRTGKFQIEMEVFLEPLENAQVEKYRYTLIVKKKDE